MHARPAWPYVGTTARVTGAHLHYEVMKDGSKFNPLRIKVPTGRKLGGNMLAAFRLERDRIDADRAAQAANPQFDRRGGQMITGADDERTDGSFLIDNWQLLRFLSDSRPLGGESTMRNFAILTGMAFLLIVGHSAAMASVMGATPIYRPAPIYPPDARKSGVEGFVAIEFTITTDGKTSNLKIIESEPNEVFDLAVTRAVARWEFEPATVNGKPTAIRILERFNFELGD